MKGWLSSFVVFAVLIAALAAAQQWAVVAAFGGVLVIALFAFAIAQAARDHARNRRAMAAHQRDGGRPRP